ncbi:MAG: hemagglutinin protein [bacterium]|nr:hemagglutinin protein [bacterium]
MTRNASFLLLALLVATPAAARPQLKRAGAAGTAGTVCQDTPNLAYGGGPLMQHVKVVDVFWSPNYKYKTMLESFYKAILQSAYFDWLVEYNTTSYKISRGTFVTSFEDTNPAPAATATVKQVNPETYLKSLLATAGKLPPPDDDTIYIMYFPDRIDPTDGQGSSCVVPSGSYCAYHASYTDGSGQNVRYAVMPDMDAAGCMTGCGPVGFPSVTDVSSHELIEAVTDPDNGTGWADPNPNQQLNCGEIGDICATGGTMEVGIVAGFTVQKEWSNKANACITVDPSIMVSDFTVAADAISVPAGGSATGSVTLTKVSGATEAVTLSATGLPTGLSASLSPASAMSAGGTSMVTVSAQATLAPGTTLSFTVKGVGSAVTQTATVNVTIVDAPDMAMAGGGGNGGGNGNNGGGGCAFAGSAAGSTGFATLLFGIALLLTLRRRRA